MSTIAAISTGYQTAAIAVVRVSGEGTKALLRQVLRRTDGRPFATWPDRRARLARLVDEGGPIDDVVCTLFEGPASYTGEDMAEISCHGGLVVVGEALDCLLRHGACPAAPGEFTKRAFLNGRLDLAQSEAVMDLIGAKSRRAAALALTQAGGVLSGEIEGLRRELVNLDAEIMVGIDYAHEGIEPAGAGAVASGVSALRARVERLLRSYAYGRAVTEGIPTAIVGRPNVGKSSLMNALAGSERSIVTEVAGTTRDVLDETVRLGDLLLRLYDTAGIRETDDTVERIGVERARRALEGAQLVLAVFDRGEPLTADDRTVLELSRGRGRIVVLNKSDRPPALSPEDFPGDTVVCLSAATGEGLAELETAVRARLLCDPPDAGEAVLTNARHREALRRADERLAAAAGALEQGVPPDVVEIDIREAIEALGEILGRSTSEDVIERIFERFCVGK